MKASPKDRRASSAARSNGRARADEPEQAAEQEPTPLPEPPSAPTEAWTTRVARALRSLEDWRLPMAAAMLVCGIAFVVLGWYGAAHTNILTEQIPYLISGGLLGVALIVVAGVFAAASASDRETRALRREIAEMTARLGTTQTAAPARSPAPSDERVYVVRGGRSYHRAGCPIIEGKEGVRKLASPAAANGLAMCKLCGAD